MIVYSWISLILSLLGIGTLAWAQYHPDEITLQYSWTTSLIFLCVTIGVNIATLFGAHLYNVLLVGVGVLWLLINLAFNIFLSIENKHWADANGEYHTMFITLPVAIMFFVLWTVLLLYPYVTFIIEVRSGVMSPETYPRQEYSCCCV